MIYVDANIVIRFILNDNAEMADYAQELLETGDVIVLPEVMAEIVYVLTKVYKIERSQVSHILLEILKYTTVIEPAVMDKSLSVFGETSLDFVDCLLYSYHGILNWEICTFDKKLQNKLIGK